MQQWAVQLPPTNPEAVEPYVPRWSAKAYDPPEFLEHYPVPQGYDYNVYSFLGKWDPHHGKYFVRPWKRILFFKEMWKYMVGHGRRMYLAESYNGRPYR
jgi:hypothetical protein